MNELINALAGLGVPGLVLIMVMGISGFTGAAALTTALATLGGPFGMLGGIAVLGLLSTLANAVSRYGVDFIAQQVIIQMLQQGRTQSSIIREINDFPLITEDLKARLRNFVQNI